MGGDGSDCADIAVLPGLDGADPWGWAAVAALGVLCTGVAYLIYFRLIGHGPESFGPVGHVSDPGVRYLVGSSFPR